MFIVCTKAVFNYSYNHKTFQKTCVILLLRIYDMKSVKFFLKNIVFGKVLTLYSLDTFKIKSSYSLDHLENK